MRIARTCLGLLLSLEPGGSRVRTTVMAVAVMTAFLSWPGSVAASSVASNSCAAEKVEASGEFAQDILLCTLAKTENRHLACFERAEARLAARFAKAERRGACKTTGDAETAGATLERATEDLAALIGDASADRCTQRKLKLAADATQALFGCGADAAAKGAGHGLDPACVDTARERLRAGILRVEAHGACSTGTSAAQVIDEHVTRLAVGGRQTLSPPISTCSPIEITAFHGDQIFGNARLSKIENGRVACMNGDDGTIASCAFSAGGASGQWVESPQGNFALAGQAISLDGVPGGDYVIASRVADGAPAACMELPSMDTLGGIWPGEELATVCLVEDLGQEYNALSSITASWQPLVNFVPLTHEVCSSDNPNHRSPDAGGILVRSFASAGSNVVDTFCYSDHGAALNDINGVERDVFTNYYAGTNYCHQIVNGGLEVPGAKRPATRSLPAPGIVDTRTPILWRPVNPNVTIANPPPSTPGTPVTSCGTTLNSPGQYFLANDLFLCSGDGVQITTGNVVLTLSGHTISGRSSPGNCDAVNPQVGIRVTPGLTGVQISGGTVERFVDGVLAGSQSTMSRMTVRDNCGLGIVPGNNTMILESEIANNSVDGISLVGALGSTIRSNIIHNNGRYGVLVTAGADDNTIFDNVLTGNGVNEGAAIAVVFGSNTRILNNRASGNLAGILLQTDRNVIDGNTASDNQSVGISIAPGQDNLVQKNTATGNGLIDMQDGTAACGTNNWQANVFVTDEAGGVADGGPDTGCIRGTAPLP